MRHLQLQRVRLCQDLIIPGHKFVAQLKLIGTALAAALCYSYWC